MNTFRMVTELWWPASCWFRVDVTSGIAVATTARMTAAMTGTIAAEMEILTAAGGYLRPDRRDSDWKEIN